MEKVLLIDTNVSSQPIYQFLKQSGYEVFVAGGNPHDYLAKTASNYLEIDYSNTDQLKRTIDSIGIDFLVPGCNDLSYKMATIVNTDNRFYGLDSLETTETINDKKKFRQFGHQINLPIPKTYYKQDVAGSFKLIVKPVDAYSGRGVTIIEGKNEIALQEAINNAINFSRSRQYIIEEYIEGQLYSHSGFIKNENIVIDFLVEEFCTANPFVVDTSRVVYDFDSAMIEEIRNVINTIAQKLKLKNGLIHTQFIKTNNQFYIIEITRRCPGDLYSQLIEMSTAFCYAEAYVSPFLNKDITMDNSSLKSDFIMRHTISQKVESAFTTLEFKLPLLIERFIPLSLAGDTVKESPFGRIGLRFTKSESQKDLITIYSAALKRNLYTLS